ncbi:hypothetical protein ACERK3_04925 [Phycisphaerales bacterium AB-hyl4]|uniref:DUF4126 domain-containing protein n=1 Tax=Natronomicrosphaera hydrolytica TaxID=3242702 RepID=A0ABV4U210_9BACT
MAQATGLTGVFASRVFIPIFAAAMLLRFGPDVPGVNQLGMLMGIDPAAVPTWFTHDVTLWILGSLALLELLAHKNAEARQLLNDIDPYIKPIAAGATLLGIATVTDMQFVEELIDPQALDMLMVQHAGVGLYILTAFVVGGTFIVATAHNALVRNFIDIDESDDTGLMKIFSWGQDLWAAFGILFLILFPIIMAVLILIGIGIILLLQKRAQIREERSKVPCPACQEPMYRVAIACGNCGHDNPNVCQLTWLGTSTALLTHNKPEHPLHLISFRRCRKCATRLHKRTPHQQCPACQTRPFNDPTVLSEYDRLISSRLGPVMIIGALLSLIPIVGLIPGVIYYRLAVVAPYRRYLGRGRALLMRWLVRILAFFLILLQVVPGVGIITVPTLAWLSHRVYRGAFLKQLQAAPSTPVPTTPVPAA